MHIKLIATSVEIFPFWKFNKNEAMARLVGLRNEELKNEYKHLNFAYIEQMLDFNICTYVLCIRLVREGNKSKIDV